MAVLRDRATNVLDMIIEGFRNQGQPVQAGSPMQNLPVASVREPSPVQRAIPQALGQLSMRQQPLVRDIGSSIYERRTPYVPTGTQMDTPVAPPSMVATPVTRERTIRPRAEPRSRVITDETPPEQESPQGFVPQQAVSQQVGDPMGMGKLAEDASKVTKFIADNPQIEKDPTFVQKIQEVFGGRENMIALAMAFNSMRLEPDAQLTAALSKQLEGIQKASATTKTQQYVVQWLRDNGYEKYIPLAMQDPKMAAEIAKQIAQKELKPDVALSYSTPRVDQETNQVFVIETNPNTGTTRRINVEDAKGLSEKDKAKIESDARLLESDIAEAQKKGSEFFQKAQSLDSQIAKYTAALDTLDRGAATGWWNEYFPTFKAATQEFQMIANSLGIDIINSATFGALSESELKLALQTGLPDNLNEEETRALIKRKIAAQAKLRDQLYEDALMLSRGGMGFNQFKRERATSRLDEINRQRASGTQATTQSAPAPAPAPAPQGGTVLRFDRNGNPIQ